MENPISMAMLLRNPNIAIWDRGKIVAVQPETTKTQIERLYGANVQTIPSATDSNFKGAAPHKTIALLMNTIRKRNILRQPPINLL